ncbi:MAG: sce7725 family protein [Lachnospiraceae bacterium]|nr:sce7725 family protein [Lachnospiraceae bacterium]
MYYPYLRGRQNELLCIRELLEKGKLSTKIVPIIEPVRFNATFFSTLSIFIELKREIILIHNPKVGSFNKEYKEMKKKIEAEKDEKKKNKLQITLDSYLDILKNEYIIAGYINNEEVVAEVLSGKKDVSKMVLINCFQGNYKYYEKYGEKLSAKLTLIPKDEDFKDEVYGNAVILEDGYNKAKRNVDYINSPDDFFSRNHIIYEKRGYVGFSDYSIVGSEYDETGFAPLAIAIHIMYYGEKKELRVHHFVSESNENIFDPARKFEEAMKKLLAWELFDEIPKTEGFIKLVECYNNGKFPGLGVIKRYSLMHHIQMMSEYLGDE